MTIKMPLWMFIILCFAWFFYIGGVNRQINQRDKRIAFENRFSASQKQKFSETQEQYLSLEADLQAAGALSVTHLQEINKSKVRKLIERALIIEKKSWDKDQVDAMLRIAWKESRYNPKAQNPNSTAYGLWQFLDSTWKYYGIPKTSDPLLQTIAGVRYISDRYETPKKALAFHLEPKEVNGKMVNYY